MKTLRLLALAALPLAAQHLEDGRLYVPVQQYPAGKGAGHVGHGETRMAVIDAQGRRSLLDLPRVLEGRSGLSRAVAFHQGTLYALGRLNHPLFDRVGDRYFHDTRSSRGAHLPHALYKRQGTGAWQHVAWLPAPLARIDARTFLPLGGDRFLVRTMIPALEVGGRKVPFALLAPDGRGGMFLEAVPGLAGLEEGPLWKAEIVRLKDRLLLLQARADGGAVFLDDLGRRLPGPDCRIPGTVDAAAPRGDGQVLVSTLPTSPAGARSTGDQAFWLRHRLASDSPQSRLLAAWAEGRTPPSPPRSEAWALLDPVTGALQPVPPPAGRTQAPNAPTRWAVQPDGHLFWHSDMPLKAFGQPKLLDALQLPMPPRKPQP